MSSNTAFKTRPHKTSLRQLTADVRLLRSLIISIVGEDPEGAYRPSFVRALRRAVSERPTRIFRGSSSFLSDVNDV